MDELRKSDDLVSSRGKTPEVPTSIEFAEVLGFEVRLIPRNSSVRSERNPLIARAIELEKATMRFLGDERVDDDVVETFALSSFALLFRHGSRHEPNEMVGAIRFMTGTPAGVKTVWDAVQLDPGLAGAAGHPALSNPCQLVDAMSLAPRLDTGEHVGEIVDALLGAARCIGGALFHGDLSRWVTAYLHSTFLRHASRLGYPFSPLISDTSPAIVPAGADRFIPVIASLLDYDVNLKLAGNGSHLAAIRQEYLRITSHVAALRLEDW